MADSPKPCVQTMDTRGMTRLQNTLGLRRLPSQPCLAGWASAGLRRAVRAPAGDSSAPHRPHPRLCHPSGTVALCFHYFARDFDPVPPGTDARSDSQALRGSSPLDRARGQKESNANSPRCATPPRPSLTLRNARRPPAGGGLPGLLPQEISHTSSLLASTRMHRTRRVQLLVQLCSSVQL